MSEALDQFDEPSLATFKLAAFDIGEDGEEDVEIVTSVPSEPSIRRPVSLALLYGLAILTLDHDGTIERRVDELLADGAISEIDAVNRIALLTKGLQ